MKEPIFTIKKQEHKKGITTELQKKINKAEERLATLAQIVGEDFKMQVKFGELNQGSYFNPEDSSITLDPRMLLENRDWLADFIAGHEGGHRAITRSLNQIGVKKEKFLELYKKIGYGYSDNCQEDCADNNWVGSVFEKFKESSDKNYQESFQQENAPMITPAIKKIIDMLGYVPKFVSFNSEVIRKWAIGEYSKQLEPEVIKALKKTEEYSKKYWQEIPDKFSRESERLDSARKRFQIFYENIWPEIEKLVKMDINQEKMRELANEMFKKMKEQKKSGEKSEQSSQSGSSDLPPELQEELNKLAEENLKEKLEELEKKLDKLKENLKNADSDEEKNKLNEQIKDLMLDKDDLEKGDKNVIPWDKLSEELKEKLQEIYNKLPKEVRDKLTEKAGETLEEIDDVLIKESRGKLNEDGSPLTHEEIKEIEEQAEQEEESDRLEKDKKKEQARERKKLERQIKAKLEGELSEYDKIYREVAPMIDEFYNRIHQVFLPQRHPRWIKGKPTGHRLDLAKVMQFEADKSLYDKLWERKTIPKTIDYRFTLLVDLSGSMSGEKIEQTFKALVVISEVLNRLGIKTQILGFQDVNIKYKDFDENLSPQIRKKLLTMKEEVYNKGEHNRAGYNSDGYCLQQASKQLTKNKGKDNFILVLSDGLPAPDSVHSGPEYDLDKVIADIRKKTSQKLAGLGVGKGTGHVAKYYPTSLPNLSLKDMSKLLGALLEDMIKFPAKYK